MAIALCGVAIVGCGGGQTSASAGRSRSGVVTDAGPVRTAGAGWPAFLHGPSHFGAATATGPQTARLRWRRSLGAAIVAGPVTSARGVAYVATNGGVLSSISVATGKDRWRFDGGGSYGSDLSTAPLVLGDGTVIWPGPRHLLFALSPGGRPSWTLAGSGDWLTPVMDPANDILVAADQTGQISGYRLRAGARAPIRLWSHRLANSSYGSPAVAANGTIYETAGHALFALTSSGRVLWKVQTPDLVEVSPAVADGGVVVFGSDNRQEYGVDPTGQVRWRVPIGNYSYSSPLALAGDRVIFGNHSGQMTVLDSRTGHLISRDQGQGELWTAAAVDNRGDAYFASITGHIFGFDATGHPLFDLDVGSKVDSYPALAPDGTLLIGANDGTLYAVR